MTHDTWHSLTCRPEWLMTRGRYIARRYPQHISLLFLRLLPPHPTGSNGVCSQMLTSSDFKLNSTRGGDRGRLTICMINQDKNNNHSTHEYAAKQTEGLGLYDPSSNTWEELEPLKFGSRILLLMLLSVFLDNS
ncbi:hypothetical protein ACS0TY_025412 [Phlomoides rotata]